MFGVRVVLIIRMRHAAAETTATEHSHEPKLSASAVESRYCDASPLVSPFWRFGYASDRVPRTMEVGLI